MPKFRKRPVVIEAEQLTERIEIKTLEGVMTGNPGDWLVTGVQGEQYPVRADIFEATYEPVDDAEQNTDNTMTVSSGDQSAQLESIPFMDIVATIRGEPVRWQDDEGNEHLSHPMPPDEPTVTLPLAEVRRLVLALQASSDWEAARRYCEEYNPFYGWQELAYSDPKYMEQEIRANALAACPTAVKAAAEDGDEVI